MRTLLFFLLVLSAAAAGYLYMQGDWRQTPVVAPVRGPAVEAVYATGTVEPTVMISIAPRLTGRLVALHADEGDTVAKGEVLAQMEDRDLRESLAELQVRIDLAKKEYDRQKTLVEKDAVARQVFDQAAAEYDAAKAAFARTEAELGYLQLIAPEDGKIIRRDGEIGEVIPANQQVFSMSCCAPLRISAEVDEEDIPDVREGQPVLISADAFPERVFKGRVQAITPQGDPVARSYRVRVAFDGEVPLLTGMTAETNIILSRRENALLLPAGAVRDGHVFVVEDGHMRKMPVKTGVATPFTVEIISAIDDGDLVLQMVDDNAADGQAVKPVVKEWTPRAR